MNWIRDIVRPRLRAVLGRDQGRHDNLWRKCDSCGRMIFHREFERSLAVCTSCGHHMAIKPEQRFAALFDDSAYEVVSYPVAPDDPLRFRDVKRYADRLRDARAKSNSPDAMLVATGSLGGADAVVAAQDFDFLGGSMGVSVGNATVKAAEAAVERAAPLIIFAAAGGARMQEGILSLMQMPRTTLAIRKVRETGLPYISVLTNPTTGGVTASYAMLGDIQIAEPNALICFAGPRVIEQTIREKLPEGFQRAEHLLKHGLLDMVVPRHQMRDRLITLLRHLTSTQGRTAP